jgi:dethiobiotin synthetase
VTIFITATNTEVGKTFASVLLLKTISNIDPSIKLGAFKPIETGVDSTPLDAAYLLKTCQEYNNFKSLTPQEITSYTFLLPAAPFVASNGDINIQKIKDDIKKMEALCDILVIEGAGGLMVPIKRDYFMIDLIKESADFTLLVTPSKLGCINDTLLSIEALKRREIPFDWCINLKDDKEEFSKITEPFYKSYFERYWFLEEEIKEFAKRLIALSHQAP